MSEEVQEQVSLPDVLPALWKAAEAITSGPDATCLPQPAHPNPELPGNRRAPLSLTNPKDSFGPTHLGSAS